LLQVGSETLYGDMSRTNQTIYIAPV